jgi:lipopolysaccharide export system permease protein
MIRMLDRLIIRSFLRIFMGFIVGAPMLFLVGDIVERVDLYFDRGLTTSEVAMGLLYKLPQFVAWSFPIAALLAAVFTIHNMTIHREVLAAKAGGISFHRLMVPLLLMGTLLTGAAGALWQGVPLANRRANQILGQVQINRQWRASFVYGLDGGGTLTVRRLTVADGRMSGIVLELPATGPDTPARRIQASEAVFSEEAGWVFLDGYQRLLTPEEPGAPERTYHFDSLRTRGFSERPVDLLEQPTDEDEMTRAEIDRLAANIERSGGDSSKLTLEREQRVAIAVVTFVIILFGGPLATSSRRGGSTFGIGIALGTTMVYMLILRVSGALGETGALDPGLAAWLPNAIFGLGGLLLLRRVRT